MLTLYAILLGLALIAGLAWLLIQYGKTEAESENKDVELKMHQAEQAAANKPAPNSFDDIIDRL